MIFRTGRPLSVRPLRLHEHRGAASGVKHRASRALATLDRLDVLMTGSFAGIMAMRSSSTLTLGIRAESKIRWERRVPLVPETVQKLVRQDGVKVLCEPSTRRAFTNEEYIKVILFPST